MGQKKDSAPERSILVIDDDLAIRVLLEAVLTRMKFSVDLAPDGAIGLEQVRTNNYHLILLDLMMPTLNGYEFLEKIREEHGENYPHTIVFTAAGQRGVDRIPDGSICDSILKPFDLEIFIQMIERCTQDAHPPRAHSS